MKNKEIKINGLEFENGHIIIGIDKDTKETYMKIDGNIFCYTPEEMIEIYDFDFNN